MFKSFTKCLEAVCPEVLLDKNIFSGVLETQLTVCDLKN